MDQVSWFEPCDHYIDYNNLSVLVLQVLGTVLDDYFAENTENGEMNHLESSGQFEAGCTCQHS